MHDLVCLCEREDVLKHTQVQYKRPDIRVELDKGQTVFKMLRSKTKRKQYFCLFLWFQLFFLWSLWKIEEDKQSMSLHAIRNRCKKEPLLRNSTVQRVGIRREPKNIFWELHSKESIIENLLFIFDWKTLAYFKYQVLNSPHQWHNISHVPLNSV